MNRGEAIKALQDITGIKQTDIGAIIDAQDTLISQALKKGEDFTVGKSGKLAPHHRAARTGRNPANNQPVEILAKTTAKFKPSKDLLTSIA